MQGEGLVKQTSVGGGCQQCQRTHIKGQPNSVQLGKEVTIAAAEKQVGPGSQRAGSEQ